MRSKSWLWAIVVGVAVVLAATVGPVLAHDAGDEGSWELEEHCFGDGSAHHEDM